MSFNKIAIVFTCVLAVSFCMVHPVNQELVDTIKAEGSWTPMEVDMNPFAFTPIEQLKALLGTKKDIDHKDTDYEEIVGGNVLDLPTNFDARQKWPTYIHPIFSQGKCASCWAVGATVAMSDRYTIGTNGIVNKPLSPQVILSCDTMSYGCQGGYIYSAWNYMYYDGLPTLECVPYTSGINREVPACQGSCSNTSHPFIRYPTLRKQRGTTIEGMKEMIYNDGPINAGFDVYEDFFNYYSGIYEYVSGQWVGGHGTKILGWGVENGVNYWLCANTWGATWGGLNGYFKIKMGECGIEDEVYAALPDLSNAKLVSQ